MPARKTGCREEKLVPHDLHDPARRPAALAALERQMRDAAAISNSSSPPPCAIRFSSFKALGSAVRSG